MTPGIQYLTKVSTLLSENVQIVTKVSIFCVDTIIFQHCLNSLGHGMTLQSWWMFETLHSSTFCLRMPHRCSIAFRSGDMLDQSSTFSLSFFSKAVVGCLGHLFGFVIMLEYCPAVQFPKVGDHTVLQYITVHVCIHGSLNDL